MKLELKDMQISKVEVIANSDGNDDLKHYENILNPTSFALIIKRNLSSGWYKEIPELDISGRLKSIVVSVKIKNSLSLSNSTSPVWFTEMEQFFPHAYISCKLFGILLYFVISKVVCSRETSLNSRDNFLKKFASQ